MPTLVLDPAPADFKALLERRQLVERSTLIDLGAKQLAEQIDWP
jgi:hypothetical protein